jgi:uncharacterized protein YfdQ (DUF2303 family)
MKYVRFRNIKQLEQDKLKDLIEMIEENLSGTSAKSNEDLLPPISAPVHHERLPIAQKPKDEEKDVKPNVSNEESNSGSVASITKS